MSRGDKKLTFVEEADVETQVFDWGKLWWLSEPRVTEAEKFSAGVVVLNPGKGHSRHNHPGCEEILYVISGKGRQGVELPNGRVEREVGPGVLVHIPPDVYHSTVNTGSGPMRLLAIYAPPGPEEMLRKMDGVVIEPPKR
jgi:oxalate decarboxylase/phosphoglucose isomerase-like protein (cupin superfamily)